MVMTSEADPRYDVMDSWRRHPSLIGGSLPGRPQIVEFAKM
jgi:hypothetical protein